MNNAIRTILAVLGGLVALIMAVGQCTTDAAGATVCSAAWLSPKMGGVIIAVLTVLNLVLKMVRPGGALAGLFSATAVVVPENKSGVGTVTQAQVNQP